MLIVRQYEALFTLIHHNDPLFCRLRNHRAAPSFRLPFTFHASRFTGLVRIIHDRFCCNRRFAAATSPDAVGPASRQVG
jgi:hypothetical protein